MYLAIQYILTTGSKLNAMAEGRVAWSSTDERSCSSSGNTRAANITVMIRHYACKLVVGNGGRGRENRGWRQKLAHKNVYIEWIRAYTIDALLVANNEIKRIQVYLPAIFIYAYNASSSPPSISAEWNYGSYCESKHRWPHGTKPWGWLSQNWVI